MHNNVSHDCRRAKICHAARAFNDGAEALSQRRIAAFPSKKPRKGVSLLLSFSKAYTNTSVALFRN